MTTNATNKQPLTVLELAHLYGRNVKQIRYALRYLGVEPRTLIRPRRYNPDDLIPAFGEPPQ